MSKFSDYLKKYGNYLEDIRKNLYRLVITFLATFIVGFFLTTPFLKLLLSFLKIKDVSIITTSPFQIVDLAMTIGLFFGILIIFPVFIWRIYVFLKPALLKKERKIFIFLIPFSLFLFIFGFLYGFFTLYYALNMMAEVNVSLGIINMWDISNFISQIFLTSVLLGIIFQFPIIITFLIKLKILNTSFLKSKRKHAVVAIFIFVSLLPPTDGLSLVVMSVPLVLIYEMTIFFNSFKKINN